MESTPASLATGIDPNAFGGDKDNSVKIKVNDAYHRTCDLPVACHEPPLGQNCVLFQTGWKHRNLYDELRREQPEAANIQQGKRWFRFLVPPTDDRLYSIANAMETGKYT